VLVGNSDYKAIAISSLTELGKKNIISNIVNKRGNNFLNIYYVENPIHYTKGGKHLFSRKLIFS
jgi:hypothetical protein